MHHFTHKAGWRLVVVVMLLAIRIAGADEHGLDVTSPHDEGTATTIGGNSSVVVSTDKAATMPSPEDSVVDLINRVSTRPAHGGVEKPLTMPSIDASEIPRPVEVVRPPQIDDESTSYEAYGIIALGFALLVASGIWQLVTRTQDKS